MELIGKQGRAELTVAREDTALVWGSGLLPVLATPRVVALMEQAAVDALSGTLEPGKTTVGTRIDIRHNAATPIGMRVWAQAVVTAAEGRAVTFAIEAFDEAGSVATADHQRFVVEEERFMHKAEARGK